MKQQHGFSLWQIVGFVLTAMVLLEAPAYGQLSGVKGPGDSWHAIFPMALTSHRLRLWECIRWARASAI